MKSQRRILKSSIRKSKKDDWRTLLQKLDEEICGEIYRIARRHLNVGKLNYQISSKTRRKIVQDNEGEPWPSSENMWRAETLHDAEDANCCCFNEDT